MKQRVKDLSRANLPDGKQYSTYKFEEELFDTDKDTAICFAKNGMIYRVLISHEYFMRLSGLEVYEGEEINKYGSNLRMRKIKKSK